MLIVAVALGLGVVAAQAPSGEASKRAVRLGFLPEPGWYAFQTGGEVSPLFQTVAVASNVPLDREDQVAGLADPSGLPYATLMKLRPGGIVIVASFTRPSPATPGPDVSHPRAKLPLRLPGRATYTFGGTQIRPDEPLGQYQIRAEVKGRWVDLTVYFGTPTPSSALRVAAQRQLDRLVVEGTPRFRPRRTATPVVADTTPGVVDRTFSCKTSLVGGLYHVYVRGRSGSGRSGASWSRPPFATVGTGAVGDATRAVENELAWVTAGRPAAAASIAPNFGSFTFPFRTWGTVAINRALCAPTTAARVPLRAKGLRGGAAGAIENPFSCVTPRRVLVRVRAVLEQKAPLKTYRSFLRTTVPARQATLVARTPSGKPLLFAQVTSSGKTAFLTARGCEER